MSFANTSWTTADFDSILKDFYLGPVQDTLNNKTVLLNRLSGDSEYVSGRNIIIPMRIGRNEGRGAAGKGGKLPNPGQQEYDNLSFPVTYYYMRMMFPGPDMKEARNDRGAFMRLMDSEINNCILDGKHEFNRIIHGNGSGALCKVTTDSVTSQVVEDPGGFDNPSLGTLFIRPGMILAACDSSGVFTDNVTATVTTVTPSTQTIVFDQDPVTTAGDYFVTYNGDAGTTTPSAADTGWDNEMMGIAGIIDDADPLSRSLQGVAVSGNDWWKAKVMDNGGTTRPLTLDLLQQSEDELDIYADASPTILHSAHNQRRKYLDLLEANKRYVNSLVLDGGFKALEYNEVPWTVDKDCVDGRIYFLDEDVIGRFEMSDFFFLDKDGSILSRDSDRDIYQATIAYYGECGTFNRKRGLLLTDLET
ncbi:MAG: phage major capsid protein [Planctomycetes bacterium]|nr:phage major capsid protein [Planctomycetota bacterium]